jgi:hypothetical protein
MRFLLVATEATPHGPPRQRRGRPQTLVDAKPAEGGHPLEWAVPAYFLGDMSALAAASLRAER